jgi:hypothetical protein
MLYFKETCNSHSKTNFLWRLSVLIQTTFRVFLSENWVFLIRVLSIFALLKFEEIFILVHDDILCYSETCGFHSETNLIRSFNILHNVLLVIYLHFIELLSIYHSFQFEETFILTFNVLLWYISENRRLKVLNSFILGIEWKFHKITLHLSLFSILEIFVLAHNDLLCYILLKHSTSTKFIRSLNIFDNVPLWELSLHLLDYSSAITFCKVWKH